MRKILIGILLLFSMSALAQEDSQTLIFVINSAVNPLLNAKFISETVKTVEHAVSPAKLEVRYVELPELERLMASKEADFFLSTSSTLRRYQPDGLKDMVTASSPFSKDPNKSEGSLIIVNARRDDLNTIADLKGKRSAAGRPTAFGMYLAAMGEIAREGYDARNFFSSTKFYGLDRDRIIDDVVSGKVDVGILRVCYLEDAVNRKAADLTQLKFINLQKGSDHVCLHSTALYPNWTIGVSPKVPASVVSAVTVALISQKPTGLGLYWSVATDFTELDQLHRSLNLGSFERFSHLWFKNLIFTYRYWFAAALSALLLMVLNLFLVSRLVRIRTRELNEALKRENQIFHEAKEANSRMLRLQRAGVVSQISGLIAHELNQPLGSIKLYARALQRAQETGRLSTDKLKETLSDIRADADLAASIVDRVRSYAKGESSGREAVSVPDLIAKSVREFNRQTGSEFKVLFECRDRLTLNLNPLEFELVMINLMRNAAQAMKEQNVRNPKIYVSLSEADGEAKISIEDDACISEEVFSHLNEPVRSKKSQGLGLGLQIVRGIIENHGGKLIFARNRHEGLTVEILLPNTSEKNNAEIKPHAAD